MKFLSILFLIGLYADIVVQINTGYLSRGMIVKERERVLARYLRKWGIIDIVVLICLTLGNIVKNYNIIYIKMVVVVKFLRIF